MNRQAGYTYISVLIIIFALSISAQATWIPSQTDTQREQEQELIFRGLAYRSAIEQYYVAGGQNPVFPQSLDQLLADPRNGGKRYIRRLYESPIGDGNWRVITAIDGGIAGVAPEYSGSPMKIGNFPKEISGFAGLENYREWQFIFDPADLSPENED